MGSTKKKIDAELFEGEALPKAIGSYIVESVQTDTVSTLQTHSLESCNQFSNKATSLRRSDGSPRVVWVQVYFPVLIVILVSKSPGNQVHAAEILLNVETGKRRHIALLRVKTWGKGEKGNKVKAKQLIYGTLGVLRYIR